MYSMVISEKPYNVIREKHHSDVVFLLALLGPYLWLSDYRSELPICSQTQVISEVTKSLIDQLVHYTIIGDVVISQLLVRGQDVQFPQHQKGHVWKWRSDSRCAAEACKRLQTSW